MKKNAKETKVESALIKDINEDTGEFKKFILILVGVAVVAVLLYFVSAKYVIKDKFQGEKEKTPVEETIDYKKISIGNVFNRPYDEYYVFAYDQDSLEGNIYLSLFDNFDSESGKIYHLDLANELNKKYVGESGNKDAETPSELSLVEPTLIKIKNGKISKYLEDLEDIKEELKKQK